MSVPCPCIRYVLVPTIRREVLSVVVATFMTTGG
jgi:hypothetical protein